MAPEAYALPYCVYSQTNSEHLKTFTGYGGEKSVEYQFDFYDTTRLAAKASAEMFVDYIKNFRGTLGTANVQDVEIVYEDDSDVFVGSQIRYISIVELKFICVAL